MDIFDKHPAISGDTLQYILYPPSNISDRPSVVALATLIQEFVDLVLPNHLWHRDTFQLKVTKGEEVGGHVIEGHMRVGDCVDDEWCVVWLLREISSKWDVIISVSDSDGEFLLIEAAEHLPPWVSPSNAQNRVWIYSHHLHLVPLLHVSPPSSKPRRSRRVGMPDSDDEDAPEELAEEEDYISPQDALKIVRDSSIDTHAPKVVEDVVIARIRGYPAAARQHVHYTKAYLPIDIAKALSVEPSLVQKPVETFYTRDALQLRAAHKMSRFSPGSTVLTTVKMTRPAYAQLLGQKFYPPKAFGRWQEPEGTLKRRRRDIGMKLACGFEMLYQESKGRSVAFSSEASESSVEARKEALERDPAYSKYIQNLVSAGYFKGETKDSALWKQLENKASRVYTEARRDDSQRRPFAFEVDSAAIRANNDFICMQDEDTDEWLNVDAADFDAILKEAMGQTQATHNNEQNDDFSEPIAEDAEDRVASKQAERLQRLAKKVEIFVEGEGDLEGARFEDEVLSDEDVDKSMSVDSDDEGLSDAQAVSLQAAMDNLVPSLDPDEYGRMPPSFHSNSQRVAKTDLLDSYSSIRGDQSQATPEVGSHYARSPLLSRDTYDGVDSDDESDEEGSGDEEEEEDMPRLIGDVEINMEEEEEEFLEFARQTLGMTDEQWRDVMKDRESRGAYVPKVATNRRSDPSPPRAGSGAIHEVESSPYPLPPKSNFDLNNFEAVMKAMDSELARLKSEGSVNTPPNKDEKIAKEREGPEGTDDIQAAMDAELKAAMEGEDADEEVVVEEEDIDYGLIKNFLESFKSQAGLPGPVGNLVGRLEPDWTLPRDT